ncbi:hypothetical protein B0H34DRAFT_728311 [Crassisporium funariophilum]|nr:hypothetical protein B0H34DRAFT_728311 [Crassisporium funariophilum]
MLGPLRTLLVRMCDPRSSVIIDSTTSPIPTASTAESARDHRSTYQDVVARFQNLSISDKVEKLLPKPTPSTSPILSTTVQLPPEIMAQIFATICHADWYIFPPEKNPHKKMTPLVLGQVCGEWRAIIWSTPFIWSHVYLNLSATRYSVQVELLADWLARSGVCPLTIKLLFEEEGDWTDRLPMELIQLLACNAHRWRAINFVLPESWYHFLEEVKYSFPLLTSVLTQPLWADCGQAPPKRKRLELFRNAQLLTDLHLNGYYLSDVDIEWERLTRFTLQHVYLDECFYALAKTPNLTYCRVYTILLNDVGRELQERDMELMELKHLVIYSASWVDTERLLSHMSFPALLWLEISSPQTSYDLPSLPTLLRHAECRNIKRLKLSEFQFGAPESELLQCLRELPSLTDVDIEMQSTSVPVCHFIADVLICANPSASPLASHSASNASIHEGAPYFLPNLEKFKFSGPVAPEEVWFDEALAEVLECRMRLSSARRESVARLVLLEVRSERTYDFVLSPAVKKKLQDLVGDGLKLAIVFGGVSWL